MIVDMETANDPIINIENASCFYKNGEETVVGVEGINLAVNRGEFVVILGHNGSGKSTLAKLLNGFLTADEGKVTVNGIDAADEDRIFELRKTVGMVFQNPDNQMVASIIEDDIAFGPENLGVPPEEIRKRVDWALDAVGMTEYATHTPFKLSGGQKQRIAIAAILAMKPDIIVLDESTSMLDPKGRGEVLDVVHRLNREENMTVILITHYMDEAVAADKAVVMAGGEILKVGSPKEVFGSPELIKKAMIEMPVAPKVAEGIKDIADVGAVLTDEEFAEALCRLK